MQQCGIFTYALAWSCFFELITLIGIHVSTHVAHSL
jgi:hypothetical protein